MTNPVRTELDSMVVEIELTLVSIIQGVALSFLIDSARHVMSMQKAVYWPYVLIGLLVILIFWSRSVLHIITVIRWPLEFGHNFLYIACALVEALLFTQLNNPGGWFAFAALFAAVGWLLFIYDLRLLRGREKDSSSNASNRLFTLVTEDQWRNIRFLLPGVLFLNVICVVCIRFWPDFFLIRNGHVWLAMVQLVGFSFYLLYVLRFFKTLAPWIQRSREERRNEAGQ